MLTCTKTLTNADGDGDDDGDADAGVTRIALLILRIVELKIKNFQRDINIERPLRPGITHAGSLP